MSSSVIAGHSCPVLVYLFSEEERVRGVPSGNGNCISKLQEVLMAAQTMSRACSRGEMHMARQGAGVSLGLRLPRF